MSITMSARRLFDLAVLLCCTMPVVGASGSLQAGEQQPPLHLCLPPVPPIKVNDPQIIREYSDTIASDYDRYFREVEDFFRCFSQQWDRVFWEAKAVTEDFERLDLLHCGSNRCQ